MTPYSSLAYFAVLVALVLPMIAAALSGRVTRHWIVLGTLLMLLLQYALPVHGDRHEAIVESLCLLGWGAMQVVLLKVVLKRPTLRGTAAWSVPLAALPLVIVKAGSAWISGWSIGFDGISYVTFRSLDVLWCISDGILKEAAVGDYLIFLFFFPTISSGPIDRCRRFRDDWRRVRSREDFWDDFDAGIGHIFRGLLYKFIIATLIDRYVLPHSAAVPGFPGAMQYGLVWGLYLFFDFAGYSAFAIGVSRCFGIRVSENFAAPFAATNVRDFWSRWHISLSTWFRDHIYMRFMMTARRRKWFAKPETASMAAYYVSFGTMGLWHGFNRYYIAYGLYHATLLVVCENFTRYRKSHPQRFAGAWWKHTAHALTILCVSFGFWLFSGHGWTKATPESPGFFTTKFLGNHHHQPAAQPEQ